MARQPIGDLLDSLGLVATIDDGDLISGAVVLLKVVDDEGDVVLRSAYTDGVNWLERRGMAEQHADAVRSEPNIADPRDDD